MQLKKGFTRINELLRENIKSWKSLQLGYSLEYDVPVEDLTTLRQRLESGETRFYELVDFDLSSARTGTTSDIYTIEGDYLSFWTNGPPKGIGVRLNSPTSPIIYIDRNNTIRAKFFSFYLVNGSQTNKTLQVLVGRNHRFNATTSEPPCVWKYEFGSIRTDKDSHFSGAITQNNVESEELTRISGSNIIITGLTIQSDQALDYRVIFWTSAEFDNTNLDDDAFCGEVELDLSLDGIQIGGTNQYYWHKDNLDIHCKDLDKSRTLRVSLMNLSASSKNAGATGEVVLEIFYKKAVSEGSSATTSSATMTVTSDDPDTPTATFTVTGTY